MLIKQLDWSKNNDGVKTRRLTNWRSDVLAFFVVSRPAIPNHIMGNVVLVIFTLALFIHGRQQEWTYRLDFLWKSQVG